MNYPVTRLPFGRLPMKFGNIPHWSALMKMAQSIIVPQSFDYTNGVPRYGMMKNDVLGLCAIAGVYHAIQLWSSYCNPYGITITEPDSDVLLTYGMFGYDPKQAQPDGSNPTDQGCCLQDVLAYLHATGAFTGMDGQTHHKLPAYFQLDVRNFNDLARAMYEGGCIYTGIEVASNVMVQNADGTVTVPPVWDYDPSASDLGGHCVIMGGRKSNGNFKLVSWGAVYEITPAYMQNWLEEAYVMCDRDWITKQLVTPLGLTIAQYEAQMAALKEAA